MAVGLAQTVVFGAVAAGSYLGKTQNRAFAYRRFVEGVGKVLWFPVIKPRFYGVSRLPNTLFMAVEGWDSPQQLITLDLAGVMVSAGSACSSGKVKPSKTISAMGLTALATGGVRVSGGWGTVESDWARFADAWVAAYNKHKTRAAERVREVA